LDKKQDYDSIELVADKSALEKARVFVLGHAERMQLPEMKVFKLELALEELLVNVVNYAYQEDTGKTLTVGCVQEAACMVVCITDVGRPFNPLMKDAPELDKSIEEREIGGLGIFLTRQMVDDFKYERTDGKNISTFKLSLEENEENAE